MKTHTLEEMFSQYASVALQEEGRVEADIDPSAAVIPAEEGSLWRRCEARTVYRRMCSYEVLEANEAESLVIEEGEAFALNRSRDGILLFMGRSLSVNQLIEVHTTRTRWGRTANVYEIRWARPVPVESGGNLYLLGGRRIFGPCHYLSL